MPYDTYFASLSHGSIGVLIMFLAVVSIASWAVVLVSAMVRLYIRLRYRRSIQYTEDEAEA